MFKQNKPDDFVIATGYKSHKIEDYLQQMKPKFRYRIVDSGDVDIIQRIRDKPWQG